MNPTVLRLLYESLRLAGSIYLAYTSSKNIINLMNTLGPNQLPPSMPQDIPGMGLVNFSPRDTFDPDKFLREINEL